MMRRLLNSLQFRFAAASFLMVALHAIGTDPDVRYAVVCGEHGQAIASRNLSHTQCSDGEGSTSVWSDEQMVHVRSAIIDGGKTWALCRSACLCGKFVRRS